MEGMTWTAIIHRSQHHQCSIDDPVDRKSDAIVSQPDMVPGSKARALFLI
jgi:hypothetical protein